MEKGRKKSLAYTSANDIGPQTCREMREKNELDAVSNSLKARQYKDSLWYKVAPV